jgi:Tol biopolymer transport system component
VAVDHLDLEKRVFDIWLYDLARGSTSRFTFDSKNTGGFPEGSLLPVWSPDGRHIAFGSTRDGGFNLYQKASNGAAQDEALDTAARHKGPADWSRDGRYIIETVRDHAIWVLPLFGDRKPFPYLDAEFDVPRAKLSPNGQLLAYMSNETKRFEIYVQTFPNRGGKWMVSTDGGGMPVWSRDGKELFFIGADRRMMAVEVKSGVGREAKFEASVPKPLFITNLEVASPYVGFAVTQDGRFLIPTARTFTAPITVEVNWTAGLKK